MGLHLHFQPLYKLLQLLLLRTCGLYPVQLFEAIKRKENMVITKAEVLWFYKVIHFLRKQRDKQFIPKLEDVNCWSINTQIA